MKQCRCSYRCLYYLFYYVISPPNILPGRHFGNIIQVRMGLLRQVGLLLPAYTNFYDERRLPVPALAWLPRRAYRRCLQRPDDH